MTAIKRIAKDYAATTDAASGIWAKTVRPDDLSEIALMIVGPPDTPYEGCFFFFTINPGLTGFAPIKTTADSNKTQTLVQAQRTYPYEPPQVLHQCLYSFRVHPNLYQGADAKVCLSILGTWAGPGWAPLMTFNTIAMTILSILDSEPLRNEPGFAHKHDEVVAAYTEIIRYSALRESVQHIIAPALRLQDEKLPPIARLFADEIRDYCLPRHDAYLARIDKLAVHDGQRFPACPYLGSMAGTFAYAAIAKTLREL